MVHTWRYEDPSKARTGEVVRRASASVVSDGAPIMSPSSAVLREDYDRRIAEGRSS